MTWGNPPPYQATVPANDNKKITPEQIAGDSEHSQQVALFAWAADNVGKYPQLEFMFAIPNGFYGDSGQKGKMKAEGLRAGVCDVFLPCPVYIPNDWHGCFIEMKIEKHRSKKDSGCSEEQVKFINYARNAGYYVKVCYNWMEARDTIVNYLEGKL